MKATFFTVGSLVAAVSAQSLGDLPACGQLCANNMLADDKANELGCSPDDLGCLCTNVNFTYGLRDCSLAVCSEEDAQRVLEYGQNVCSGVGVLITTTAGSAIATRTGSGTADAESTDSADATVSSFLTTLTTAVATTIDGGAVGGLVTTFTSDGSQIVSTLTSEAGSIASSIASDIVSSASGIASEIESSASAATSEISSAVSSLASEASGAASEASSAASGLVSSASNIVSSITNSAGSVISTVTEAAPTSTESDGLAPKMTAAPMGIIAAAGLAALLL